ncbi:hypothetical protein [Listeria cornellensis]|uniref:Uncharacterized protein n=1 Tax=Listeria cornellensis FSL F6-0969 TaxID=1265820 RepID=W7BHC4_9LIST|nr:hypothetical protein [Listeria cornellensis]EUJ24205.1 hypothetical protein PCORN_18841 [Listeria cornellensis FSL F6-0969]
MLNSKVNDVLDMYYNGENESLYITKSSDRLMLPTKVVKFCELNNIEISYMTEFDNPSDKWYFTMGAYKENSFEVEYTSIVTVSKLANVYAVEHSFEVLNKDPRKIEPVLVGDAEAAFNFMQFDLEELIKESYEGIKYSRMFWAESWRKIEGINFSEDVTLFGPDVTQGDILFRDVLDKLPD